MNSQISDAQMKDSSLKLDIQAVREVVVSWIDRATCLVDLLQQYSANATQTTLTH